MPDKTTIQISNELHHFLTIQAISKNETFDQIIRRLFRQGVRFSIDNRELMRENKPEEVK